MEECREIFASFRRLGFPQKITTKTVGVLKLVTLDVGKFPACVNRNLAPSGVRVVHCSNFVLINFRM